MMKWMYATFSVLCMLAIASGGSAPAAASPSQPQIGGCRWFCDGVSTPFLTRAACQAVCASDCEQIC